MAFLDNLICFHDLDSDGNDDSGNGFDGTVTGATFDGTYASFNGTTDNIATARLTALDGAQNVSFVGWISRAATNVNVGFGRPSVTSAVFSVTWADDGNLYVEIGNGSGEVFPSAALTGTGLHSVVVAFDGTQSTPDDRLAVYIDGAALSLTATGGVPATIQSDSTGWTYGKMHPTTFGAGKIRCGAVFARTLTAGDATTWNNSGTALKYADLLPTPTGTANMMLVF